MKKHHLIILSWLAMVAFCRADMVSTNQVDVRLQWVGSNPLSGSALPVDHCPPSHFFGGLNAGALPTVEGPRFLGSVAGIYPGIDMACYGDDFALEYVLNVSPGADLSRVRLRFPNSEPLEPGQAGTLVHMVGPVEVVQTPPVIYQTKPEGIEQQHGLYRVTTDQMVALPSDLFTGETTNLLNGAVLLIVPGEGQAGGPIYTFYAARHENSNRQFLEFLNDAQSFMDTPRGDNMFFDRNGNVWINSAAQPERDEVFKVAVSRLVYRPDFPVGKRYDHVRTSDGKTPFADHPVIGVSWYGAVKYCNWLTIHSGRGAAERCYREGTNALDWAPMTATNWAAGQFNTAERQTWLRLKGFRLPMLDSPPDRITTNRFNEFYKMAAWSAFTNWSYAFGRNHGGLLDANVQTEAVAIPTTRPVGFYNGKNLIGRRLSRPDANFYGFSDLSGNVSEWMTDPVASNLHARIRGGGSYQEPLQSLSTGNIHPAASTDGSGGFRPLSTYIPPFGLRIHLLFTFHLNVQTQALPSLEGVVTAREAGETTTEEDRSDEPIGPEWSEASFHGIQYQEEPPIEPPVDEPDTDEPDTDAGSGTGPIVPGIIPEPGGGPFIPFGTRLLVTAQAPGGLAAVQITVSGNTIIRNTPFQNFYATNTAVTLQAPLLASGWDFVEWLMDGAVFPGNNNPVQSVTMTNNINLQAVYQPPPGPFTLTVLASAPGGTASMVLNDPGGPSVLLTPFTQIYPNNTPITLTAAPLASGWQFVEWQLNGLPYAGGTNAFQSFVMLTNRTMMAMYQFVPPIIVDPPVSAGGI